MTARRFRSLIGRYWREVRVYWAWITRYPRRPVLLMAPCDAMSGWGSDLRSRRLVTIFNNSYPLVALYLHPSLSGRQRRRLGAIINPEYVIHQSFMNHASDPATFPDALNILDLDDAHFHHKEGYEEFVRRCRLCDGAIAGSTYVAEWLAQYVKSVDMIWTPSPVRAMAAPSHGQRPSPPRLVWSTTRPLSYHREAEFVRKLVISLAQTETFVLQIIGDVHLNELSRYVAPIEAFGVLVIHMSHLDYERYLSELALGAVGLAPLMTDEGEFVKGKSFGKILAYIAAGLPVIASDAVDHPLFFENGVNGFISNDFQQWQQYARLLLKDSALRDQVAHNAFLSMRRHMDIGLFAEKVYQFMLATREKVVASRMRGEKL